MNGGLEFLFWILVFALVGCGWAISEIIERRRHPRSPWMKRYLARKYDE